MCCIICSDFKKGLLTRKEASLNLSELEDTLPEGHADEVNNLLLEDYFEELDDQETDDVD